MYFTLPVLYRQQVCLNVSSGFGIERCLEIYTEFNSLRLFGLVYKLQKLFILINIYQVTPEMHTELHEDLHVSYVLFLAHFNKKTLLF